MHHVIGTRSGFTLLLVLLLFGLQAAPAVAGVVANCIMSGACAAGKTGTDHIATIKAAALERLTMSPDYGYRDDESSGRVYGPLVWSKY